MIIYREEEPGDHDAIFQINQRAFGGDEEARLVDALRKQKFVITSRVAESEVDGDGVVGYILFSTLPIKGKGKTIKAAALAPMAVDLKWQGKGIGSRLVLDGLAECLERGVEAVIVVGHPKYYPRFGFSAAMAENLSAPFSGEAFMAVELTPGVLSGFSGTVKYPPPFG